MRYYEQLLAGSFTPEPRLLMFVERLKIVQYHPKVGSVLSVRITQMGTGAPLFDSRAAAEPTLKFRLTPHGSLLELGARAGRCKLGGDVRVGVSEDEDELFFFCVHINALAQATEECGSGGLSTGSSGATPAAAGRFGAVTAVRTTERAELVLSKNELDGAAKDKHHLHFPAQMQVHMRLTRRPPTSNGGSRGSLRALLNRRASTNGDAGSTTTPNNMEDSNGVNGSAKAHESRRCRASDAGIGRSSDSELIGAHI